MVEIGRVQVIVAQVIAVFSPNWTQGMSNWFCATLVIPWNEIEIVVHTWIQV